MSKIAPHTPRSRPSRLWTDVVLTLLCAVGMGLILRLERSGMVTDTTLLIVTIILAPVVTFFATDVAALQAISYRLSQRWVQSTRSSRTQEPWPVESARSQKEKRYLHAGNRRRRPEHSVRTTVQKAPENDR